MSGLTEQTIQERLKEAMRARRQGEVMVLRGLVAAIKNLKIEKRSGSAGADAAVGEADITQIVRREIKQREEAIGFAEQASRSDLVDKNREEKRFLEAFLPVVLSSADLAAAIAKHHGAGATSIGALMGKLKAEFGARLDGRAASEAIRQFLNRQEGP